MEFADAFNMVNFLENDLQSMTGSSFSLPMMTDSISLFDILTKALCTTGKRLKISL